MSDQPINPPSRYKGRCDVHGLRTCDECQFGETDAKLLAVAEARIAALEAQIAEAQERLAMAVEAAQHAMGNLGAWSISHQKLSAFLTPTAPAVEALLARVRAEGAAEAYEAEARVWSERADHANSICPDLSICKRYLKRAEEAADRAAAIRKGLNEQVNAARSPGPGKCECQIERDPSRMSAAALEAGASAEIVGPLCAYCKAAHQPRRDTTVKKGTPA